MAAGQNRPPPLATSTARRRRSVRPALVAAALTALGGLACGLVGGQPGQPVTEPSRATAPVPTAATRPGSTLEVPAPNSGTSAPVLTQAVAQRRLTATTVVAGVAPLLPAAEKRALMEAAELPGLENRKLSELGRFRTAAGTEVAIIGMDGAKAGLSQAELAKHLDYFEKQAAKGQTGSYDLQLTRGPLKVNYKVASRGRERMYFIFSDKNLQDVYSWTGQAPDAFTTTTPGKIGVSVIRNKPGSVDSSRPLSSRVSHNRFYGVFEVCQQANQAQLDPKLVQSIHKQPRTDMGNLTWPYPDAGDPSHQVANIQMATQERHCATGTWALTARQANFNHDQYAQLVKERGYLRGYEAVGLAPHTLSLTAYEGLPGP